MLSSQATQVFLFRPLLKMCGFEKYIENYKRCLPIEQAAVDNK